MTEPDAASSKSNIDLETTPQIPSPSFRKRNAKVFGLIVVVWLAFDLLTKSFFNGFTSYETIAGPFLGLFRFRLVHNTGAAWGMFDNSTIALGILSIVVCALLMIYLFALMPRASLVKVVGIALVFAGGVGNAINRFMQGFVVDFIELTFIDFPVFNIADIGVTCGFVLFIGALLFEWRHEDPSTQSSVASELHE